MPSLSRLRNIALLTALLCTLALGCSIPATSKNIGGCPAGTAKGQSSASLEQVALCITSAGKTRAFTVEIARTSAEQSKGMMFRTELADDAGMLFPFPEPKLASFWMKNTSLPLDIIFIRSNGTIESIAENTVPYSMASVESGEPVAAVLELRGGLSAELGIAPGDRVEWRAN